MKKSLKLLSLFLAASVPGTIAAEFAGLPIPAPFDTLHVFAAYVMSLVLLTGVTEYAQPVKLAVIEPRLRPLVAANKASHALAA